MPPIRLLARSFIGETTAHILWAVDPPVKLRARSRIGGIFPRRSRGWRLGGDFLYCWLFVFCNRWVIVTRAVTLSKQVMGVVVQSLNYCPVTFLGSVTFSVTPTQRLQNMCSVGLVLGVVGGRWYFRCGKCHQFCCYRVVLLAKLPPTYYGR